MVMKDGKWIHYPLIALALILLLIGILFGETLLYREAKPKTRHRFINYKYNYDMARYRANRITGSVDKDENGKWVRVEW